MSTDASQIDTDDVFGSLRSPYVATFTGRIPFLLGIPDHLGHTVSFYHPFLDPAAARVFGPHPTVDIRVFTLKTAGIPVRAPGAAQALKHFYGDYVPQSTPDRWAEDGLADYKQWVTLQTQGARAAGEDPNDKGYTFHRCLSFFNLFIQAVMVATQDFRLRTVVAQDFKPALVVGAITLQDRRWRHLTDMMMFPDFPHKQTMIAKPAFTETEFRDGLARIQNNAPFIRALLWRGRVDDAMQRTGDAASAIVGLQTAAEAMLFDTYRMLLVDEGYSRNEIDEELASEPGVSTLVKTLLKDKLGGHWDPTVTSTPVGRYWDKLYQVRNDTVHRGFQPHFGHAEEARDAYTGLAEFVAERVQKKCRRYPRTLLALVGEEGLRSHGWLSASMKKVVADARTEPGLYFQPWDEAGRPGPSSPPISLAGQHSVGGNTGERGFMRAVRTGIRGLGRASAAFRRRPS